MACVSYVVDCGDNQRISHSILLPIEVEVHPPGKYPEWRTFPFIFDTGADVSVIPISFATEHDLPIDKSKGLQEGPSTLTTKMTGYAGHIRIRFLAKTKPLPCFFQVPAEKPSTTADLIQVSPAVPNVKKVKRRPRDLAQWMEWSDQNEQVEARKKPRFQLVLGRTGFLNAFNVMLQGKTLFVSTEAFRVPKVTSK